MIATLVLFTATFGLGATSAQAHVHNTCPAHDRTYTVVSGDTLSKIADRYRTNWPLLAAHNLIVDPNLIYVDQTVCIPAPGSVNEAPVGGVAASTVSTGVPTQAVGSQTAPSQAVGSQAAPSQAVGSQAAPSQPSVKPAPPSVPAASGSVTATISSVFGAYAGSAIRVAMCESGLNPGASNAYSYGGSHAAGLFQIMYPSTWRGTSQAASSPYNALANTIAAHEIFVRDGYSWSEWTCKG